MSLSSLGRPEGTAAFASRIVCHVWVVIGRSQRSPAKSLSSALTGQRAENVAKFGSVETVAASTHLRPPKHGGIAGIWRFAGPLLWKLMPERSGLSVEISLAPAMARGYSRKTQRSDSLQGSVPLRQDPRNDLPAVRSQVCQLLAARLTLTGCEGKGTAKKRHEIAVAARSRPLTMASSSRP